MTETKKEKVEPEVYAQKCVVCNGYTTVKHGELICPACNGMGYLLIPVKEKRDDGRTD